MKKLILILLLLLSIKSFSQDADTSDYFRIGLYSGSYISSHSGLVEKNKYFNSVALEAEYMQLKNLSFYVRGIYEITEIYNYGNYYFYLNNPPKYRLVTSFGAKYYLKEKNIRPYLQLGLNQETNYIGSYTYYNFDDLGEKHYYLYEENWNYYYSLNFGVGLNVKLYKKLSADIHYDLYRVFQGEYSTFYGFSILAGLKYNILY
ncbi:MAG: hypothetical protein WC358_06135 [Ignavibacteria bacterium]|jgi:outer membrane protein W